MLGFLEFSNRHSMDYYHHSYFRKPQPLPPPPEHKGEPIIMRERENV
jgi:hypothetical protein